MARTQTLVQLTDELLAQLDARATREGRSRSELIREAVTGYLTPEREAEIDRQIVEGYTREPQTAPELAFAELGTRTMLATLDPWEAEEEHSEPTSRRRGR
jgi:Arc/MetJ-type ribon-helix-helix transcriptional regulator